MDTRIHRRLDGVRNGWLGGENGWWLLILATSVLFPKMASH
eukprot:COSAG02_NODE_46277_length_350_cov_0.812749_1_plen_40_part_01